MVGSERVSAGRRSVLAGMGAAAALAAGAALDRGARAAGRITVADPGGPYGPAFRAAFYDPFERETGIQVVNVAREPDPIAQFKAMVQARSFVWDVCTLTTLARSILSDQGLLDPMGGELPERDAFLKGALAPDWLGTNVYATVMAYRTDRFPTRAPQSWADFWDVERFPGRRALSKNPVDLLEFAVVADGVPLDQVYPIDVDRAFRSLDRIKPHVNVWWTTGVQSTQLIQSGEVHLAQMFNARAQAAMDGGVPVRISWNQGLYGIEGWAIPRNGPRAEDARRFVRFCADAKRQSVFTQALAYGPTNLKAYESIPPERAALLPTYKDNLERMFLASDAWWAPNRAAVTERFNAWLLA